MLHSRGSWSSYLFTSGFERIFGVRHIIEVLYVVIVRVISIDPCYILLKDIIKIRSCAWSTCQHKRLLIVGRF